MSAHRPHVATVRLTEAQHVLAKKRLAVEPGMSFQKLLTACVNSYAKGELVVSSAGVLSFVGPSEPVGSAISFEDDPEALDLDDLTESSSAISFDDDGEYDLDLDDLVALGDSGEVISTADLENHVGRPSGSQAERTIGTRELAALAEKRTGRSVNRKLLRQLIREEFRADEETGPGTRYRWAPGDPEVEAIIERIAQGALIDLRERRLGEVEEATAAAETE